MDLFHHLTRDISDHRPIGCAQATLQALNVYMAPSDPVDDRCDHCHILCRFVIDFLRTLGRGYVLSNLLHVSMHILTRICRLRSEVLEDPVVAARWVAHSAIPCRLCRHCMALAPLAKQQKICTRHINRLCSLFTLSPAH